MTEKNFKAMVVTENADKTFTREIATRSIDDLPQGDVLIRVQFSSLNYKDALSATGNKGVTRNFPHTPGIDAAGIIEDSKDNRFQSGEEVIVTSYDLGMNTDGGFSEYIRVPADWVVKKPASLTLKEAMIYGTAGFTAGLSVHALTDIIKPDAGEVLVTGSSGGVGSVSISILSKIGYDVVAAAGLVDDSDYLLSLGAKRVISKEEAADSSGKPVLKSLWSGVIDTVGGDILATAIKSLKYGGAATCCGNAASADLPLNVYPFILRGVRLIGIDSQNCPMEFRSQVWDKLANEWKLDKLLAISREITLEDLEENIQQMLQGQNKGRAIVNLG